MIIEIKETCGPLFLRCVEFFTQATDDKVCLFAAGHMTGQAEKIYLGACPAMMCRPSPEYGAWMLTVAAKLSEVYGLEVSLFERPEIADEIWLHRPAYRNNVALLSQLECNSPEWHRKRGLLCGIPSPEIDPAFHERAGYRERCEPAGGPIDGRLSRRSS